MKLFRKLKVFVLLFAVLALVLGFSVLIAPKTTASTNPCNCHCMICMLNPPYLCWDTCCKCPTGPPIWEP
jgi:hypothetical protein